MIRVLLADDDPLVRSGLRLMLAAGDLEVVGEVGDGSQVADAVARLAPDVVLMDIRMPLLDGIAATRSLRSPGLAVLVLTTFGHDRAVLEALRAGAAGYLLKDTPPTEIVAAIRKVADGEPVLSPAVTRSLIARATAPDEPGTRSRDALEALEALTARERDVALAVAEGLSNGEIAERLHLSTSSVKAHLSSALTRLGLDNRVQLAILAHSARCDQPR
ncbi:response regulator transcription factor [Georgenia halophila]|uniref:response regulator transcription factor n=1 Tax=Georgenia halophila TaxID=620889 RepID=UPI0031ED8731